MQQVASQKFEASFKFKRVPPMFSYEQYLDIFKDTILIFKNKFASVYIIFLGMDGILGSHSGCSDAYIFFFSFG